MLRASGAGVRVLVVGGEAREHADGVLGVPIGSIEGGEPLQL